MLPHKIYLRNKLPFFPIPCVNKTGTEVVEKIQKIVPIIKTVNTKSSRLHSSLPV